jgi:transposase
MIHSRQEVIMARPKSVFTKALAERAQADLDALGRDKAADRLWAIICAAKFPLDQVAEVSRVSAETIWRWAVAYTKGGVEGLAPKPKKPKPSKLAPGQKETVLRWIDEARTPKGKHAHWTLEKLGQAISAEFGVCLSANAIWAWLRNEGMKPKAPRPRHYEADGQAQEEFKKKRPRS